MVMRMTGRVAAFATGALAGLIASRTLPPLLAQAGGMARGTSGRDLFDVLIEDHQAIASLLDELEQTAPDAVFDRTQKLLRLKRRLTAHAMAEEDVVYPMVFEQMREAEEARHLYSDHAAMKVHLYALEEMPKDDPGWLDRVRTLKSLIEDHVQQEEEVDFPKLRAELDDTTLTKLFRKMQREKASLL